LALALFGLAARGKNVLEDGHLLANLRRAIVDLALAALDGGLVLWVLRLAGEAPVGELSLRVVAGVEHFEGALEIFARLSLAAPAAAAAHLVDVLAERVVLRL